MDTTERDKALLSRALLDAARLEPGTGDEPETADLQRYLRGELPEAETERIRSWLVANEAARVRLRELAPFVEATPPADDAPADLALEASWQALQRRLAEDVTTPENVDPSTRPPPAPIQSASSVSWWQALAAVLMLTAGLLLLRVFQLESGRDLQNLRKLELIAGTRSTGVETFPMVLDEPFLVEISPGTAPDGCTTFEVELLDLENRVLESLQELKLTDHILRFTLRAQPGERQLTVSACGKPLDRHRVNLVAAPP